MKVDNVGTERMSSGRLFQATGPATQNVRLNVEEKRQSTVLLRSVRSELNWNSLHLLDVIRLPFKGVDALQKFASKLAALAIGNDRCPLRPSPTTL